MHKATLSPPEWLCNQISCGVIQLFDVSLNVIDKVEGIIKMDTFPCFAG